MDDTTIRISKKLKRRLHELKVHPRQTYEELIERILDKKVIL